MSSNMVKQHKDVLDWLLYLDTRRGKDATGVAAVRKDFSVEILKQPVPGYIFLEGPRLEKMLEVTDWCWIGHNRFGTVGKNTTSNAHPFKVLNEKDECMLVGAHNGTLTNRYNLPNHADFGTDSEGLLNAIANGKSVEAVIGGVEGAWALTWFDQINSELRMLRNKERPLHYAYSEDKQDLFWASEAWMIRVATSACGIKLHNDSVVTVTEDTLYKFSFQKARDKISLKKIGGHAGKAPAPFQQLPQRGRPPRQGGLREFWMEEARRSGETTNPSGNGRSQHKAGADQQTTNGGTSNSPPFNPDKIYRGYKGQQLSLLELEEKLVDGCRWCEMEALSPSTTHAWLGKNDPVCHKCLVGHEENIIPPLIAEIIEQVVG